MPTESTFKLGIEIAGYDDLETAGVKLNNIAPASCDKDGKRAIWDITTEDTDQDLPITFVQDGKVIKTDASVFINVSDSQPAVGFGGGGGGADSTIYLWGTFESGGDFGYDVVIKE